MSAFPKEEREELIGAVSARDTIRTHHAKCHLSANHRDCAIMKLLRALDATEKKLAELVNASTALINGIDEFSSDCATRYETCLEDLDNLREAIAAAKEAP